MNAGKIFENNFKKSVPKEVFYLRLKDSASSFKQDSCATRFTLQNPYDILLFDTISLYTFELKSTDGTSFSFQRENDKSSKMIKFHQIKGLLNANEYDNVYSGFVFDFRKSETYFLRISNFVKFMNNTEKVSINEKDIINYGGIKITKARKKVNYTYDIKTLLKEIKECDKNE